MSSKQCVLQKIQEQHDIILCEKELSIFKMEVKILILEKEIQVIKETLKKYETLKEI